MSKLPIKREFSAGGCVYQKFETLNSKPEIRWLIGQHSGYHKWVLPKGMIEAGEKGIETAVRETQEEMGVVAKVIGTEPIHKEEYWFVAELKNDSQAAVGNQAIRRVAVYQEDPGFEDGVNKIRVFKTVTFYLMEYASGDPAEHDWEMSAAGWYGLDEALELLAFDGEKRALTKASELVTT